MRKIVFFTLIFYFFSLALFSPKTVMGAAKCPGGDCRFMDCDPPCIKDITTIAGKTTCVCVKPAPTQKGGSDPCDQATQVWTALGCLPAAPRELVVWFLGRAIGIGGGIAFLLMIFGGFQVLTSAGNPERLNSGREVIGSALIGLLLIIFSLFILQLIGIDILGLENVGLKFGP